MNTFKQHLPLLAALALFSGAIVVVTLLSVSENEGHLVYALDDPYIHMAMAKNLVQHGVWGVHATGFTSTSSSPLWTLLLACTYLVWGVNALSPFIVNAFIGAAVIITAYVILRARLRQHALQALAMIGFTMATPIPTLVLIGQEHILQILLSLLFVFFSSRLIADDGAGIARVCIFALLLTAVRYEGAFLVLAAGILLALRKQWIRGAVLCAFGALPIVIYGLVSRFGHGWFVLPNPVLLKGGLPDFSSPKGTAGTLGYTFFHQLAGNTPVLLLLCAAIGVLLLRSRRVSPEWRSPEFGIAMFIVAALLHLQFASINGFYRYEAYLIALGIITVASALEDYSEEWIALRGNRTGPGHVAAIFCLLVLLFTPLAMRGIDALRYVPRAAKNIYEQQYQMGLFVNTYYQHSTVALNDIGAVNYLADIETVDLYGLASREVAALKMENAFDAGKIRALADRKNVKVAIVYDRWFDWVGGIPPEWQRAGEWRISHNLVCAYPTVTFYAVDREELPLLVEHLRDFSRKLPGDVAQAGRYTVR